MKCLVLCQGLNAANLLHCPHGKQWKVEERQAAVAFGVKHKYSHLANVQDGKVLGLAPLGATT